MKTDNNKRIAIIGGGASGVVAAIVAANNGGKVCIFEHSDMILSKLLRTGNGKCNLSNSKLLLSMYNSENQELINDYFKQFDNNDTINFFRGLGIVLTENNDRIYPITEKASTVRDVLLKNLSDLDVEIILNSNITGIEEDKGSVKIIQENNISVFDRVIVATGSYAGISKKNRINSEFDGYSLLYKLGAKLRKVSPALSKIELMDPLVELSGQRIKGILHLYSGDGSGEIIEIANDFGEVQFTDYGISGIPAMNLSRFITNDLKDLFLTLDVFPNITDEEFELMIRAREVQYLEGSYADFMLGLINEKLGEIILNMLKINPDDLIFEKDNRISEIKAYMRNFIMDVKRTRAFEDSQVCRGGVYLTSIDKNCRLKKSKNIFVCGEVLDVDARCGGYNLQWAFSTGYIAGLNAASL